MNTNFDSRLREIDHYKRYPAMIPFVGDQYESSEHRKVLIIAESNYLNEHVTVHHDADAWYKKSQDDLDKEHIHWIDCRALVSEDSNKPGHKIYKNINKAIESVGLGKGGRGIDHVAFMNAFQRPSPEYGESMKGNAAQIDLDVSAAVIKSVVDILEPDCVIFASKYAWGQFHSRIDTAEKPTTDWVYHAGDNRWWNRGEYPNGEAKFIEILKRLKN